MASTRPETHVTYIRDADRSRIIYVFDPPREEQAAREHAERLAPLNFRFAAVKQHDGSRMHVPMDGDDYGGSGVPVKPSQVGDE